MTGTCQALACLAGPCPMQIMKDEIIGKCQSALLRSFCIFVCASKRSFAVLIR